MVFSVGLKNLPNNVTPPTINKDQGFEVIIDYECKFGSVEFTNPIPSSFTLVTDGTAQSFNPGLDPDQAPNCPAIQCTISDPTSPWIKPLSFNPATGAVEFETSDTNLATTPGSF
jgi:hypothetical protein